MFHSFCLPSQAKVEITHFAYNTNHKPMELLSKTRESLKQKSPNKHRQTYTPAPKLISLALCMSVLLLRSMS